MASPSTDLLEMILRECAGARPQPWYPSEYARATGVQREALDSPLDQLRLGGLIRLTEWEQGKGQGYTLTPAGETVLEKPKLLGRLREGVVPVTRTAAPDLPGHEQEPPGWERARAVRDALLDSSRPVATLSLIFVNVVLFLAGAALAQQRGVAGAYLSTSLGQQVPEGGAEAQKEIRADEIRHQFGSLRRDDILGRNEWWRLLTTCFVHIGFIHLAMNMYALYVLGPLVERMFGSVRFLALYLIAGLTGSCAALVLSPAGGVAGASGAICGLIGMMASWVLLNRAYLPRELVASMMRGLIINVILIAFISMVPGVSFAGHLGGGAGGLVAAAPMTASRFGHGVQHWLGFVGALAVAVAAVVWLDSSLGAEGELPRARARARPLLAKAETAGKEVYDDHIRPLCKKVVEGQAIAVGEVQAAIAAATNALDELRQIEDSLPEPGDYHEAPVNTALGFAKDYVNAWIRLLEHFRDAMAAPDGFTQARALSVLGLHQTVVRLTARLTDSVLFPRK
jgi:membrane associated rhomboid family serine protease